MEKKLILSLNEVTLEDLAQVGGKNASLGEMIQAFRKKEIAIPGGYAVTASAYRLFLKSSRLEEQIKDILHGVGKHDLHQLNECSAKIRQKITEAELPEELQQAIIQAHKEAEKEFGKNSDFAVRSSATAEDLPGASFAGEHETYLNVRGIKNILQAIKAAMASLFTARAISYRIDRGFDHFQIALSVGVQKMVRSDSGSSGVMFSLDTETGFADVILINGSWGLGEMIVQGEVSPDEFLVFKKTLGQVKNVNSFRPFKKHFYQPIIDKKLGDKKRKMIYGDNTPTKVVDTTKKEQESFVLSDEEIIQLASWAVLVEEHYSQKHGKWTPMDMEWAKDGGNGKLYLIQARPETVHASRNYAIYREYIRSEEGEKIVSGASVGNKIAVGQARIIMDPKDIRQFKNGEILVTDMTDPDWEPIMKIAAAIVTDKGGRTSHAAIVSRELGIPAVVGCINATTQIKTGEKLTVDCSGQEGIVYKNALKFKVVEHNVSVIPQTKTKVMMNIATPQTAFEKSFLPNQGVGLAREEFIIASDIGIHPLALINYDKLPNNLAETVDKKVVGYKDKSQYYVDKLAYGIAKISAAFYPNPVIVRFSDFKTNEYRSLLGGEMFEPVEENPMIGFRGASRYYSADFAPAFILEVRAIKKVIDEFGLDNTCVMVPFCRTVEEGKKVLEIMENNGLSKSKFNKLKVYVMCEIPANVILAKQFLEIFDGMSIGSNDLTQLTLGIDRDGNEKIRSIANENNEAVLTLISQVIKACREKGKYVGICGQAPSDYPEFVEFLIQQGIDSISLNPDVLIPTILKVHKVEQKLR